MGVNGYSAATMFALALALAVAHAAPSAEARLVTGTGLRLRAAPDPRAAIVERVPLGTALPCLETSAPVRVGETTAPFCKTEKGWYFTALTEPLATDRVRRDAQVDALIAARVEALAQQRHVDQATWPDLYELHNLMRARIDARSGDDKLRARIAELTFVAAHPNVFEKDPRVIADDSQGPRIKNEAFEELVAASKGTSAHEEAAWALAQHGLGGECEGDVVCELIRIERTTCRFITHFPSGARAAKAVDEIATDLESQRDDAPPRDAAMKKDALTVLARVKACVQASAESPGRRRALDAIAGAEKRWK